MNRLTLIPLLAYGLLVQSLSIVKNLSDERTLAQSKAQDIISFNTITSSSGCCFYEHASFSGKYICSCPGGSGNFDQWSFNDMLSSFYV